MATKKTDYDVRYIPQFVQSTMAGKNAKTKRAERPLLFDIRTYKLRVKSDDGDGKTVLSSYVLIGGVPPKKIHDKMTEVGFKVRRRPSSWKSKDGDVVKVEGRDNECWTVYYNTEETFTAAQLEVLLALLKYVSKVTTTGVSGWLTTWEDVEDEYGDAWLKTIVVQSDKDEDDENDSIPVADPDIAIKDVVDELF
jgi:hypothetical protein